MRENLNEHSLFLTQPNKVVGGSLWTGGLSRTCSANTSQNLMRKLGRELRCLLSNLLETRKCVEELMLEYNIQWMRKFTAKYEVPWWCFLIFKNCLKLLIMRFSCIIDPKFSIVFSKKCGSRCILKLVGQPDFHWNHTKKSVCLNILNKFHAWIVAIFPMVVKRMLASTNAFFSIFLSLCLFQILRQN